MTWEWKGNGNVEGKAAAPSNPRRKGEAAAAVWGWEREGGVSNNLAVSDKF